MWKKIFLLFTIIFFCSLNFIVNKSLKTHFIATIIIKYKQKKYQFKNNRDIIHFTTAIVNLKNLSEKRYIIHI